MLANTFLEPPTISACVSQQSPLRLLTALLSPNVLGVPEVRSACCPTTTLRRWIHTANRHSAFSLIVLYAET